MNWSRCWIGLGGNQGNVSTTFDRALEMLDREETVEIVRESRRFGTVPIGDFSFDTPQYLNSAAEVRIACSLPDFLTTLQRIERDLGRVRAEYWGSRKLDLDLLLHESATCTSAKLMVPHPHLWYRRFVLDPLVELAAERIHPEREATISELRDRLLVRPLTCGIYGGDAIARESIANILSEEFAQVEISPRSVAEPLSEEALSLWLGPAPREPETPTQFEALPRIGRFDVRTIPMDAKRAIRQILRAALGE